MKFPLDSVPRTLEEAVAFIRDGMDKADVDFVLSCPEAARVHYYFGMFIRNSWSLWDSETILSKHFQDRYGVGHADDVSGIILSCVWSEVYGVPIDVDDIVKRYRKHWLDRKCDPLTGQRLES